MVNKQKRKGTDWERNIVKLLNDNLIDGHFKRVPGSGALGTILDEPRLYGDIVGKIKGISTNLLGEAKVGYGGSKQFALKKEWLDKIKREAYATYSIPFLAGRFSNCRNGICNFIVLDIEVFYKLLNKITELEIELENKIK